MKINMQELMEKYFPLALEKTKELIKIKSFLTDPKPQAPFGEGTKEVLDYVIKLGNELGFKTYQDAENRYGFLDYGDDDKELFVILCHLDVVPPGNIDEWENDPFAPFIKDGKLFGRGSFDDKGPTMMNLYGLKYLKDNNFKSDKYKIRMIFGLTEETTWESIRAYIADFGVASAGYVPDGEFPVVYAEKWIVDLDMHGNYETDFEIKGGAAYNVVADYISYKGVKAKEIEADLHQHGIKTEHKNGLLMVKGKAAHGSLPWMGLNAATNLMQAMKNVGIKHPIVDFICDHVHNDHNFAKLFPNIEDETGVLTQNLGIIDIENGKQRLAFNYRVPVFTKPKEKFIPAIESEIKKYGLKAEVIAVEDSVYVPKESEMVQKIMKVYQEVTGDMQSQPLAIGGGTYAKAMPGLVAFGAEFDINRSTMHAYNEYVPLEDLEKMLEIYTKAIVLLTK
ncbi:Sapep family Mn(2+)-dependent dipeptidase [Williamsoniiplasma lucivorax]|uniref:Dipeptidase PepV n=1 Tax=Williamsoniiplasma lucivorax TaxID=209274 RepID=A0A2S5REQ8_9MOLU|nr:Sapep family Mn(2+)-dependent dipeptidase [Williamsoniiplasma lucivorax]PPE05790.1 dipeptidase PepV [Williamsoniiplasma lucivorax]